MGVDALKGPNVLSAMLPSIVMRVLAALLVFAPLVRAQSTSVASTTVILVRHAEKAAEPAADPPLTADGAARAVALVALVRDAGVSAIISTRFQRTLQTAAPAAAALRVPVEIVEARAPNHARMVADSLLVRHRGQTVLVVGHSNTVPAIVAALGAPQPAEICDPDYDNVYVVTVPATGAASVVRMHFGAPAGGNVSCAAMKR